MPSSSRSDDGDLTPFRLKLDHARLSGNGATVTTTIPERLHAPCKFCGTIMDSGNVVVSSGVEHVWYRHLERCRPAVEDRMAKEAAASRESLKSQWTSQSHSKIPDYCDPPLDRSRNVTHGIAAYIAAYGRTKEHEVAIRALERFLAAVRSGRIPQSGVCLSGNVGCGKTTLLAAACRDIIRARIDSGAPTGNRCPVLWWGEQELWDAATRTMNDGSDSTLSEIISRACSADVLAIDNLGGQHASSWWIDTVLFRIINSRYQNGLPTLATSKYSLPTLQAEWDRPKSTNGRNATCSEDLCDRLRQRVLFVRVTGGSNRKAQIDF